MDEPILTEKLRSLFLQAAAIDEQAKKMERYRNLVQLLPTINAKTLKKLMSHLVAIASHSGKLYYDFLVLTPVRARGTSILAGTSSQGMS